MQMEYHEYLEYRFEIVNIFCNLKIKPHKCLIISQTDQNHPFIAKEMHKVLTFQVKINAPFMEFPLDECIDDVLQGRIPF